MKLDGLLSTLLFLLPTLSLQAADERRINGDRIELAAGETATSFTVGINGGEFVADSAATLTGTLTLEALAANGLTASVVARSLRDVTQDDWRKTQRIAGTRTDATIDFDTGVFGTPAERTMWGVGGTDGDWDNFSFQWDGWLRVFGNNVDLATSSDDGSRVWIDLDGDGLTSAKEWGSNNWGNGQGTTQRPVHRHLASGVYRMRVQYEEGGGGNTMRLWWNDDPHGGVQRTEWYVVPVAGFAPAARLNISGAVTLRGPIQGDGTLVLGDGVRLGVIPAGVHLRITGQVTLDADLDLRQARIEIATGGVLDCAGHQVRMNAPAGDGTIDLGGGRLALDATVQTLRIAGTGTLSTTSALELAYLSPDIVVASGTVRAGNRCVARVSLAAPLTTIISLSESTPGSLEIVARITVPANAPAGLGLGAWRAERTGLWFQTVHREPLKAGTQTITLRLDTLAQLVAEGHGTTWSSTTAIDADRIGLFLYADVPSTVEIALDTLTRPVTASNTTNLLTALRYDDFDGTSSHAVTGARWSLSTVPLPYPSEPYDPATYALDLTVVQPDGRVVTLAGFHNQPVTSLDRGDLETFIPNGAPRFEVRFRPSQAGRHRLRLSAVRAGAATTTIELPDLEVSGPAWDGITRVDAGDPRFFSAGGAFVWPNGCNLNSTYDTRSTDTLQTKLTPDRGTFTRAAYLERLAAGGGTGCETWLSPWNLGLEWTPKWPGFRGTGRYHDGHAWALDQFLDRAETLGVHVNLSIFNHGMARNGGSPEDDWKFHPYFQGNGGWLETPDGLFNDERAFTHQQAMFRYLGARYGDSPALLGWKLWAEVNLANAPHDDVVAWHDRAAQALHERDPYRHPITTHWCGDWNNADRAIAAFDSINYLTIDAYHGDETFIAELLNQSTRDPLRRSLGLANTGKPILVTEFGGSAGACSRERMRAEFAIGPWVGFVSGHAGAPMLWWFEWIDQEDRYGAFGALARFTKGEDLRGKNAQCIAPPVSAPAAALWCRAWSRPGRILGYLVDRAWGMTGGAGAKIVTASVHIGDEVPAGKMRLEWWDPDTGTIISQTDLAHGGHGLDIQPPTFSRHLAFKLWRN